MASPRDDLATKFSTEGVAADTLVKSFYQALQSSRATIASFYSPPATMPDGKPLPAIVFNGNIIPDAKALQSMFEERMPPTHYEVQSYDCQVLNPNYMGDDTASNSRAKGRNMTILVIVSGYVKIGEPREAAMRGFSETFVLVPNPDITAVKGRGKHMKEFLIQSDTLRLVV